jgi:hypothetical protein
MEVSSQFQASVVLPPGNEHLTHWIEGWMGPRASLDSVEYRNIFTPSRNRTLAVQPVSHRYTVWATPAPRWYINSVFVTVSNKCNGWLVYSCCSHLKHRASVKRFVSIQFLNLRHSVGLLGRVISPSQGRYITQTQNKHKQISMPLVGIEPTTPAFERAKTVHALYRAGS